MLITIPKEELETLHHFTSLGIKRLRSLLKDEGIPNNCIPGDKRRIVTLANHLYKHYQKKMHTKVNVDNSLSARMRTWATSLKLKKETLLANEELFCLGMGINQALFNIPNLKAREILNNLKAQIIAKDEIYFSIHWRHLELFLANYPGWLAGINPITPEHIEVEIQQAKVSFEYVVKQIERNENLLSAEDKAHLVLGLASEEIDPRAWKLAVIRIKATAITPTTVYEPIRVRRAVTSVEDLTHILMDNLDYRAVRRLNTEVNIALREHGMKGNKRGKESKAQYTLQISTGLLNLPPYIANSLLGKYGVNYRL